MSEYPSKLKSNLGAILKEKGISANKLSIDINHRRGAINDLINNKEMDKRRIPATLISDICAYLKITPNDLFEVIEGDYEIGNELTLGHCDDDSPESNNEKDTELVDIYLQKQSDDNFIVKEESLNIFLTSRTNLKTSIKNELYEKLNQLSKQMNIPVELLVDEAIELLFKQQSKNSSEK